MSHLRLTFDHDVRLEERLLLESWLAFQLQGNAGNSPDLTCPLADVCVRTDDREPSRILTLLAAPQAPLPSEWRGMLESISTEASDFLQTDPVLRAAFHLSLSLSGDKVLGLGASYYQEVGLAELSRRLEFTLSGAHACITAPSLSPVSVVTRAAPLANAVTDKSAKREAGPEGGGARALAKEGRKWVLYRDNPPLEPGLLALAFSGAGLPLKEAILDQWRNAFAIAANLPEPPAPLPYLNGFSLQVPSAHVPELLALADQLLSQAFSETAAPLMSGPDLGACARAEVARQSVRPLQPSLHAYYEGRAPHGPDLDLVPVSVARGASPAHDSLH